VQGVITGTTREPLPDVSVSAGASGVTTSSDSSGAFRLAGLPAGRLRLVARRVGYAPATFELDLPPDGTVHVAIRMGRTATVLGTVVVRAEGGEVDVGLLQEGFYDRRRKAHGIFLSPADVQRRETARASALLRDVPNVTVRNAGAGQVVPLARSLRGGYCQLDVWVDGYYAPMLGTLSFDDVVSLNNLKAIEVYRTARDVPARFQRTDNDCGAVLVWTSAPDGA
jgi:hypothetical protein